MSYNNSAIFDDLETSRTYEHLLRCNQSKQAIPRLHPQSQSQQNQQTTESVIQNIEKGWEEEKKRKRKEGENKRQAGRGGWGWSVVTKNRGAPSSGLASDSCLRKG